MRFLDRSDYHDFDTIKSPRGATWGLKYFFVYLGVHLGPQSSSQSK